MVQMSKKIRKGYTAGGIQFAPNPEGWRKDLDEFVKENNLFIRFTHPTDTQYNQKNDDLLLYTNPNKWRKNMKKIREEDFKMIDEADFVVTLYDKYAGNGTEQEIVHCVKTKKLNYFIFNKKKRTDIPHWVQEKLLNGMKSKKVVWLCSIDEFKDLMIKEKKNE